MGWGGRDVGGGGGERMNTMNKRERRREGESEKEDWRGGGGGTATHVLDTTVETRFVTRHVLSPGTFCHPARFVARHVLSPGTFCRAWNHKMVPTQKPSSAKGVTISFISFLIFYLTVLLSL